MSLTRISLALALVLGSSAALAADPDQAIRQSLKSLDANLPIEAIAGMLIGLMTPSAIYRVGSRELPVSFHGFFRKRQFSRSAAGAAPSPRDMEGR